VIIGKLVSLSRRRLAATLAALWVIAVAAMGVLAAALPGSTWVSLKPLPNQGQAAVFALGVDPANDQLLIAGNSQDTLLRSTDGGLTWSSVHKGHAGLTTIAFSPFTSGLVLAGTRGSGALASTDGGATWTAATGLEGRTVHVFGFSLTGIAAGTDHGVFVSLDGLTWTASGLSNRNIDALAVAAIHNPVKLIAGSDATTASGTALLFISVDGGTNWSSPNPTITGSVVVKLAAGGGLLPKANIRPLIAGTNAGLFESTDNGASFTPLSGGNILPSVDYTQVAFVTNHYDRYYVASDGGGSGSGGVWRTADAGQTFTWLAPPASSVTALALSNEEVPILYVATFRPSDHVAALWAYRETGGTPVGPIVTPSPVASHSRTSSPSGVASGLLAALQSSQAPYEALGLAALVVIGLAVIANVRGARR
jgi:photosystem II stability/assembly factor-like uncharacterized protein